MSRQRICKAIFFYGCGAVGFATLPLVVVLLILTTTVDHDPAWWLVGIIWAIFAVLAGRFLWRDEIGLTGDPWAP